MTRYLSAEDILVLHALVIDETGGSHGVRDVNLLASIAIKPQTAFGGQDVYTGIFTKAAVLCEALVNYHVFVDGNKRTAFLVLGRFLHLNNLWLRATNKEVEETMLAIAEKKVDIETLVEWAKIHSEKL